MNTWKGSSFYVSVTIRIQTDQPKSLKGDSDASNETSE